MIVSEDTGLGDLGPYGGGPGRGMPIPNIDKLAAKMEKGDETDLTGRRRP